MKFSVYYSKSKDQLLIADKLGRIIEIRHQINGEVKVFVVIGYISKSHVYIGEF